MPRSDDYDDDDDDRPRRRRKYDDDDDDDDVRPRRRRKYIERPRKSKNNGLATAALVLGILAIFTSCLTGVPAVICGMLAMGKPGGRGLAITGLLLGMLGTVAGIGGGIWMYTAGKKRVEEAAGHMADTNNMKQIGLGFHNEMAAKNAMRGPYAYGSANTPNTGLSWRVELLPYVEQGGLYQTFNLKEPWDGPANKGASNTPLKVYTSPYEGGKTSVNTPYRVFYGGGAFFNEDGKPVGVWDIQDGFSNTILAVHAWDQVPWAAPRDFKYDPKAPLPKLGHPQSRYGSPVLMADGSVRTLTDKVSEQALRAAITRNGGEMMGLDW